MVEIDTVYRAACTLCGEMRSMADRKILEDWADRHLQNCGKPQTYSQNVFDNNPNGAAMDPHHHREARRIQ